MCGIAGFSLDPDSPVRRTLAVQALLAGIAERGGDAVGYAYRAEAGPIDVTKLRGGASALLDEISLPAETTHALVHVRDYTKGHPDVEVNNHPIRHGSVVGIHNGVITNDDDLLASHGIERAHPEMTVDSEAIFALVAHHGDAPRALRKLRGTMAAGWLDEREPDRLYLARGAARPLWTGQTATDLFFASTRRALTILEAVLRVRLDVRPVKEGRVLEVAAGRVVRTRRFRPDRSARDVPAHYSPVHSPHEAVSCLVQLADLAAPASA